MHNMLLIVTLQQLAICSIQHPSYDLSIPKSSMTLVIVNLASRVRGCCSFGLCKVPTIDCGTQQPLI